MNSFYEKIEPGLKIINYVLAVAIFNIAIYITLAPLLPTLELWLDRQRDNTDGFIYQSASAQEMAENGELEWEDLAPPPEENMLVVPSIGVDGQINEGGEEALKKGIWRRPTTSTPDKGGNTVFIAHRFLYTRGPKTFYHLDKVEESQEIIVFWEGKEYNYEVFEVSVVSPRQIEIEANTEEPIITLYTCTPLWTAKQRLVVKARLIS